MSQYVLDTTALIDFSKGFEPSTSRIRALLDQGNDLGVCAINVAEFHAGFLPDTEPAIDRFLEALSFWPISREAATQAGVWRYTFARKGLILSTTDTLIAAVAHHERATLLTDNIAHYPMPELRVESIR